MYILLKIVGFLSIIVQPLICLSAESMCNIIEYVGTYACWKTRDVYDHLFTCFDLCLNVFWDCQQCRWKTSNTKEAMIRSTPIVSVSTYTKHTSCENTHLVLRRHCGSASSTWSADYKIYRDAVCALCAFRVYSGGCCAVPVKRCWGVEVGFGGTNKIVW